MEPVLRVSGATRSKIAQLTETFYKQFEQRDHKTALDTANHLRYIIEQELRRIEPKRERPARKNRASTSPAVAAAEAHTMSTTNVAQDSEPVNEQEAE